MSQKSRQVLGLTGLMAVLVVLAAAGAGVLVKVMWTLGEPGPSADTHEHVRVETEFIPHAVLASQLPGRAVFKPGAAALLVISRVHRAMAAPADAATGSEAAPLSIERLWITIPANLAAGQGVGLRAAYEAGRVAYDAGPYDGQVMSSMVELDGNVFLLGRDDAWALFKADLHVKPVNGAGWPVDQLLLVPVMPGGLHARPMADAGDAPMPTPQPAQLNDPTRGDHNRQRLGGQWFGQFKDGPVLRYDLHLQLDGDGRCVLATQRKLGPDEPYAPEMRYGRYQVIHDWLVITVRTLVVDEPDRDDSDRLGELPLHRMIALRIGWSDDELTLRGDYRWPVNEAHGAAKDMAITFDPRTLPDLHQHRPSRQRPGEFDVRPEPANVAQPS